jgi:ATP-dependent protease ClpP protease subunit
VNLDVHALRYEVRKSTSMDDTADIYLYSVIEDDGAWGEKSDTSANTFREKLESVGSISRLNLYVNSEGGSCFEGNAIYSMLKRHPAYKTAYIDGFACSEASVIPMACDRIVMSVNAVMMLHNPWTVACGNAKELRKIADDLDVMSTAFRQAYLKRFKGTEDELIELLECEAWLTAERCIEYGLADAIVDVQVPDAPDAVKARQNKPNVEGSKGSDEASYSIERLAGLLSLRTIV